MLFRSSKNLQYVASNKGESKADREAKRFTVSKGIRAKTGGQCIDVGSVVTGVVTRIEPYGIFVTMDDTRGFVHISEIASEWVSHPADYFQIKDKIQAVVIDLDRYKLQVKLSIKRLSTSRQKR